MIYLDPKNDLIFKKIFGEHPDILISFLNALMPFGPGQYIQSLEYLTPELAPETPMSKFSIVDVRCKDNFKREFIVEMQMLWTQGFMSRVLFNASKAYVRQLSQGGNYDFLQPVYTLSLLNENFREDTTEYYHHYKIVDILETDRQMQGLEFVFIELQKFKPVTITDKKMMILWLRFLTEIHDNVNSISADFTQNKETKKAVKLLESAGLTEREMMTYDKYWDTIRTVRTYYSERVRLAVEEGLKKGRTEGMKKGLEKGMEEGMEKGMEKGRSEGEIKKAKEIIQKALAMGMSYTEIAGLVGLSEEEISTIAAQSK